MQQLELIINYRKKCSSFSLELRGIRVIFFNEWMKLWVINKFEFDSVTGIEVSHFFTSLNVFENPKVYIHIMNIHLIMAPEKSPMSFVMLITTRLWRVSVRNRQMSFTIGKLPGEKEHANGFVVIVRHKQNNPLLSRRGPFCNSCFDTEYVYQMSIYHGLL